MRLTIEHKTRYRYAEPATSSVQCLRLTPPSFVGQKVIDWRITSDPGAPLRDGQDGFGNQLHLLVVRNRHQEIEVTAAGTIETGDRAGVVLGLPDTVPHRVYLRRTDLTAATPEIMALADATPKSEFIPRLHCLMDAIRDHVDYLPGVTKAETTAGEAFDAGRGVCQDHAHIFVAAARHLGLPARYVTGYLLTGSQSHDVAHHAWAETFVDGLGWLGFDVANRVCPTDHYVRLAAGLDAHHVAPIRGSRRGGAGESLAVEVNVAAAAGQQ